MAVRNAFAHTLIRQATVEIAQLPEEDLPMVIEFVHYLKYQPRPVARQPLSVAAMRSEARRRASRLRDVPRADLVARFRELSDEIRQQAIAKGTAIEGDWHGD